MNRLAVLIASVGGAGYAPVAPGTVGSAVAIVVYLLTRAWSPTAQVTLLLAVCLIGTWAANVAVGHFHHKDPGHVVIDEVAGQLLTLLFTGAAVGGAIVGFFVFRLLDIIKPWPANRFEALPGGVGIMADDVMAGVYGCLAMHVLMRWLPAGW